MILAAGMPLAVKIILIVLGVILAILVVLVIVAQKMMKKQDGD